MCLTITEKTNLMKNNFYLLFSGLKNYPYNKLVQMII